VPHRVRAHHGPLAVPLHRFLVLPHESDQVPVREIIQLQSDPGIEFYGRVARLRVAIDLPKPLGVWAFRARSHWRSQLYGITSAADNGERDQLAVGEALKEPAWNKAPERAP
jgi:hypothetical protein